MEWFEKGQRDKGTKGQRHKGTKETALPIRYRLPLKVVLKLTCMLVLSLDAFVPLCLCPCTSLHSRQLQTLLLQLPDFNIFDNWIGGKN